METEAKDEPLTIVLLDTAWSREHSSILTRLRRSLVDALGRSTATVTLVETQPEQARVSRGAAYQQFFDHFWEAMLQQPIDLLVVLEGQEVEKEPGFQNECIATITWMLETGQPTLLVTDGQTATQIVEKYPKDIDRVTWWNSNKDLTREYAFQLVRRAYKNRRAG